MSMSAFRVLSSTSIFIRQATVINAIKLTVIFVAEGTIAETASQVTPQVLLVDLLYDSTVVEFDELWLVQLLSSYNHF